MFDRQLPETLTQPMQPNPRGAVCNSELVRDLAQRHVTPDANQHHELVARQLAGNSGCQARNHGACRDLASILETAGTNTIRRVALGYDALARCAGLAVGELS